MLFVLVGSTVDITYLPKAGVSAVLLILFALFLRMIGVTVSLLGTPLTFKERIFCSVAYLPKATVQAAIGSLPLAAGIGAGNLILTVAVVAIVITAPLGAISIDMLHSRLLSQE